MDKCDTEFVDKTAIENSNGILEVMIHKKGD